MRFWGTSPFDRGAVADFVGDLEDMADGAERLAAIREALCSAVEETGYLEAPEGEVALVAAALVAAGRPGGQPVDEVYGPTEAIAEPSQELADLAVRALDRVLAADSEAAELWDDSASGPEWRASVDALRTALRPASESVRGRAGGAGAAAADGERENRCP
ncbi:DUF4259 domain-containing protein [Streptomyces lydicus]|uniref:DUF4259 domain-containing protein n=1 Tax=Streptomyces lydicus TaxID=47763 RepID=UPI0007C4F0BE|nr:DUF4259 domain-containing protein [Streptomyces lydicus]MDC7336826.1 DUF4259 domain-containing protein [Streptomyces lydicus]UEG93824.1 DUF4259 domain-containing protein [Streptomyces lydicus]